MSDFLNDFLDSGKAKNVKKGSKTTINNDKWDRADYNKVLNEMKDLSAAETKLHNFVDTGDSAMADTFYALMKAQPQLRDPNEIRPSYLVNRTVMDEAMKLNEYEELRIYSTGDAISSGLACVDMEPELEILFDKLKDEVEQAKKIEQMLMEMEQLEEDQRSAEEMVQQALEQGNEDEAQNFQEQAARIAEQMERLRQQIDKGGQELQEALDGKRAEIMQQMREAMKKGLEKAHNTDEISKTWGLEPGALQKLPAQRRIELAKRLDNEKYRRLAQVIGPMTRLAMAEQTRKVIHAQEEIHDITLGNNLSQLLFHEYMYLMDDDLQWDVFMRYLNERLMEYELKGVEKIAKGGIIWCEDGSGSMSGDPEIWAKAAGLALMHIARSQKRDFYAIHFGGPGEIKTFDFDLAGNVTTQYGNKIEHFDRIDGVIDFAECFFAGGTDFMTPLSKALDILRNQHAKFGAVKGDIVFCTDGMCGVNEDWLKEFKAEQERLGFKVYGIVIGGSPNSEPLKTICDNRVWTVKDLIQPGKNPGDDIRDIFRNV